MPSLAWHVSRAERYLKNYSSISTLLQTPSVISPLLILRSYPYLYGSALFFHAFRRADAPERYKRSDSHAHGFSRHSLKARLASGASSNMGKKTACLCIYPACRRVPFQFASLASSKSDRNIDHGYGLASLFFGGLRGASPPLVSYRTSALWCRITPNSGALCSMAGQLTTEANDETCSDLATSLSSHAAIKHSPRSTTLRSDRCIPAKKS